MTSNTDLLKIAQKHLGQGGAVFRKYCGLPSGAAWCNAFVDYIANEGGVKSLYFNGAKETYCPHSMAWCKKNLAMLPLYLAMPMDIIYFDWDRNGVPNHIGFVRAIKDTSSIYTIEGNTDGGKVAQKTRPSKYVCGIFRPHFPHTFKDKKLSVDGVMGYQTIGGLQKALKALKYYTGAIDCVLGRQTLMALQRWAGTTPDACWQNGTSKAIQKKLGFTGKAIDGAFGPNSVKALQKFINANAFPTVSGGTTSASKAPQPSAKAQKAVAWARKIAKGGQYTYKKWNNKDKKTKQCPICHNLKGKYKGWNCIGFVSACWHHGAGLPITCSCSGIGTDSFFTKVTLNSWTKRNGKGWQMITNGGGKGGADIPASKLIAGDVVVCYDTNGKFHHVVLYTGNGNYIDDTNTKKPHIAERKYSDLCKKYHVTRAFRFVG